MLKQLVLAFVLLISAFSARAVEYTDAYFDIAEPGWGFLLVQSESFQFIAFYIYGPDGKPVWYTAQLVDNGTGTYTGTLYATTGTYFADPWKGYKIDPAGTVTFHPNDIYHATLTYTVNGIPPVIKAVQRLTLTPYKFSGNYSGSMAGSISGCVDPSSNDPSFRGRYGLAVATAGDESEATTRTATLTFTFTDSTHQGIVCVATGPLTHFGRIYQMAGNTTIACTAQEWTAAQDKRPSIHSTRPGRVSKASFRATSVAVAPDRSISRRY